MHIQLDTYQSTDIDDYFSITWCRFDLIELNWKYLLFDFIKKRKDHVKFILCVKEDDIGEKKKLRGHLARTNVPLRHLSPNDDSCLSSCSGKKKTYIWRLLFLWRQYVTHPVFFARPWRIKCENTCVLLNEQARRRICKDADGDWLAITCFSVTRRDRICRSVRSLCRSWRNVLCEVDAGAFSRVTSKKTILDDSSLFEDASVVTVNVVQTHGTKLDEYAFSSWSFTWIFTSCELSRSLRVLIVNSSVVPDVLMINWTGKSRQILSYETRIA